MVVAVAIASGGALESQVAVFPGAVGFVEAGSLPKVALTSYKALGWYGGGANATDPAAKALWAAKPTVLVLGGSGGCSGRRR